jgi:hypothetical protein
LNTPKYLNLKVVILLISFLTSLSICNSQSDIWWSPISENRVVLPPNAERRIFPEKYSIFIGSVDKIRAYLSDAPDEFEKPNDIYPLAIPYPDGKMVTFHIWKNNIMHPELRAKFPNIRTYQGVRADKKQVTIRLEMTETGFHAYIHGDERGSIFVDPYAFRDLNHYIVYNEADYQRRKDDDFDCHFDGLSQDPIIHEGQNQVFERVGPCGNLRSYRLALACTGEYATFHGGTVPLALSAMTTSVNRVGGVFEKEISVRLILIANTNLLIYTNAATDPYTNNNGSTMLGQNQITIDGVIGSANYDIGHVFSTAGGGVAYLGSVCSNSQKAGGVTGQTNPIGDPFDIDFVIHEMGHQFGGNHNQYNNCNRAGAAAVEPGSASTIMGYAGICSPNVQSNSNDYFNAYSLNEMSNFITNNATGGLCDVLIAVPNQSSPTLTLIPNYNIPSGTPFLLTAVGADPNNDPITYNWEQTNGFSSPAQTMPPAVTNTSGPTFRSLPATVSGSRYFPPLSRVLANSTGQTGSSWEVLPTAVRTMNFKVTVRDNRVNGGCTIEDLVAITTSGTPFSVTSPNTNVSIPSNVPIDITWNVAGTTATPVSCANVDILLSRDGGTTWTVLATATPNDGTQTLTLGTPTTTTARIMVRANGNVFYDVSNVNFTISTALDVEFKGLTASSKEDIIQLDWVTASEKNSSFFAIERSENGGEKFQEIGKLPASINSITDKEYRFLDKNIDPNTPYIYRIKSVDRDGKFEYSDKVTGIIASKSKNWSIFPSLTNQAITIQSNTKKGTWMITNSDGKVVKTSYSEILNSQEVVDVSNFPNGTYFITILSAKTTETHSFIKN